MVSLPQEATKYDRTIHALTKLFYVDMIAYYNSGVVVRYNKIANYIWFTVSLDKADVPLTSWI